MNSRERLRRCFFYEELDRPAVYSRTGFPQNDPSYDNLKAYLAAHSDLKVTWDTQYALEPALPITYRREPYSEEFDRQISTLHTPAGDLEATRFCSRRGKPGMAESYFIKDREDIDTFLSLPLPVPTGKVASFFAADARMADRGIVEAYLGMNPAGYAVELMGSETFAILSITDRQALYALCEWRMQALLNRVEYLVERGVGPFFSILGQEYVLPPLHGPQDFHDFNVRYDAPIIAAIHNAGGRVHIHAHGAVGTVLQGFIDAGADVLHPLEAPPMGDITPGEAKRLAQGKLCLEGNIQIADMYESSPTDIRDQVEYLIREAFTDHCGLIVSPTASPYIRSQGDRCFPQYKAMIDAVLAYRN